MSNNTSSFFDAKHEQDFWERLFKSLNASLSPTANTLWSTPSHLFLEPTQPSNMPEFSPAMHNNDNAPSFKLPAFSPKAQARATALATAALPIATAIGAKYLLSTALSTIGMGAGAGAAMAIYSSYKANKVEEKSFLGNLKTTFTSADTYKKVGIASAFGIVGIVGAEELFLGSEAHANSDVIPTFDGSTNNTGNSSTATLYENVFESDPQDSIVLAQADTTQELPNIASVNPVDTPLPADTPPEVITVSKDDLPTQTSRLPEGGEFVSLNETAKPYVFPGEAVDLSDIGAPTVVVADAPAQTDKLPVEYFEGFAVEIGGDTNEVSNSYDAPTQTNQLPVEDFKGFAVEIGGKTNEVDNSYDAPNSIASADLEQNTGATPGPFDEVVLYGNGEEAPDFVPTPDATIAQTPIATPIEEVQTITVTETQTVPRTLTASDGSNVSGGIDNEINVAGTKEIEVSREVEVAVAAPVQTPEPIQPTIIPDTLTFEAYTIQDGDTLSDLAKKFYGASTLAEFERGIELIGGANGMEGIEVNGIRAGNTLYIPDMTDENFDKYATDISFAELQADIDDGGPSQYWDGKSPLAPAM